MNPLKYMFLSTPIHDSQLKVPINKIKKRSRL